MASRRLTATPLVILRRKGVFSHNGLETWDWEWVDGQRRTSGSFDCHGLKQANRRLSKILKKPHKQVWTTPR